MSSEEFDIEIIDLTPSMSCIWGEILGKIRTSDDVLFATISDQIDIEFTGEDIRLYTDNESILSILQQGMPVFAQIAGEGKVKILFNKKRSTKNNKVEKLRKLFGDKIKIK